MRVLALPIRALITAGCAACSLAVIGCGAGSHALSSAPVGPPRSTTAGSGAASFTTPIVASHRPAPRRRPRPPFAVGTRIVTFVDASRIMRFPGRAPAHRTLVTLVFYPAQGSRSGTDTPGAPPERAAGQFPLVIFGHGFAVTPAPYERLLRAWARAGYVVAAPIFPLENAHAPGGPNEADLVNQPRDMSFVISGMLADSADRRGFLSELIDRERIAVSGQSDGGDTALAVAYDRFFLDRRVRAAMILSGAEIPGVGGFDFPAPSPPLLATQGTADTINPPILTHAFFDLAPPPKYLLTMFGAEHLGPYTDEHPQLGIVERVTIAFLDRYLKLRLGSARRLVAVGDVPGTATVSAHP